MRDLDNKGFTLIEILAVVVIIGIIGLIAVPNVLSILNTSKNSTYEILVNDITVAAIQLHEEVSIANTKIYRYKNFGKDKEISVSTSENNEKTEKYYTVEVNLQTLVSNGFLTGTNNSDKSTNGNEKIIINPKTKKDMGSCVITITKTVEDNYNTSYTIVPDNSSDSFCPTDKEYEKALNIKQEGE